MKIWSLFARTRSKPKTDQSSMELAAIELLKVVLEERYQTKLHYRRLRFWRNRDFEFGNDTVKIEAVFLSPNFPRRIGLPGARPIYPSVVAYLKTDNYQDMPYGRFTEIESLTLQVIDWELGKQEEVVSVPITDAHKHLVRSITEI